MIENGSSQFINGKQRTDYQNTIGILIRWTTTIERNNSFQS